jgi:hypothetical protein
MDGRAATAPVYTFYDLQFEPDRPVPVLSFTAPKWPVEAKQANIQLWCKFEKTSPDKVTTVAGLRQDRIQLDGVNFELETGRPEQPGEPYRVTVIERHPPESGLDRVKVEMTPPPAMVIHRFNADAAVVRHTFFYEEISDAQISRHKVLLTTRKRLIDQAVTVDPPLEVTVPRMAVSVGR